MTKVAGQQNPDFAVIGGDIAYGNRYYAFWGANFF
jgi:hypothetical protein